MTEYLTSTKIEAFITGSWIDISSDVVTDLEAEGGIYSNAYDNRLASTGVLRFSLDNGSGNYSPSDAFKEGVKVKVTVAYGALEKVKFFGRMTEPVPDIGTWGDERVHVEVLDWMDVAQNQIIRGKAAQEDKTIDEAVTSLLADIPIQPEDTDLDVGDNTFPLVFDVALPNATYYSELNNLAMSELSYIYLKDGGQTLKVESASARNSRDVTTYSYVAVSSETGYLLKEDSGFLLQENGDKILLDIVDTFSFTGTFNNTFEDLEIKRGGNVLNNISLNVYPRNISTGTTYSLYTYNINESAQPIQIPFDVTLVLTGDYTEAQEQENGILPDGAVNVRTPIPNTDFAFNQLATADGADYSSNLSGTFVGGGSSWRWEITNLGPNGFLLWINLRGQPVFRNSPVQIIIEDTNSQETYGFRELALKQPYKQVITEGKVYTKVVLNKEREPRSVVVGAKLNANASEVNMNGFMFLQTGDLIRIQCTKPAINDTFFIQGWKYRIGLAKGDVDYEFVLSEPAGQFSPIALRFSGAVSSKNVLHFDPVPTLHNLTNMTVFFRVNIRSLSDVPIISMFDNDEGWEIWLTGGGKIQYLDSFTSNFPQWETADVLSSLLNQYVNIFVTYNGSSTTNDPIIYVNNVEKTLTELVTPVGTRKNNSPAPFNVGNRYFYLETGQYEFSGSIKHIRIYDRILTSQERADVNASPNDDTVVPDFIFTTPTVPLKDIADYLNHTITQSMPVYDGVGGDEGTVRYDTGVANAEVTGEAV